VEQPILRSWFDIFDALAGELLRGFAGRLRGFERASRTFVRTRFVALPGTITIEPRRISVQLAHGPMNVVLQLSSMDAGVSHVDWLNGRELSIRLEGL
jgi:hypothetical protein